MDNQERYITLHSDILPENDNDSQDAIYVTQVDGYEGINKLFCYRLRLYSTSPLKPAEKVVYESACFHIQACEGHPARYYHGQIKRLRPLGMVSNDFYAYELEIVPWLWWLTQNTQSRIFPMGNDRRPITVLQVLQAIFEQYNYQNYEVSGVNKDLLEKSDFWMQYKESDYDFILRLLFDAGIFYYFKHEDNRHVLVLGNRSAAYAKGPASFTLRYARGELAYPRVVSWVHGDSFVSGTVAVSSYEYLQPKHDEQTKAPYSQEVNSQLQIRMHKFFEHYLPMDSRGHTEYPPSQQVDPSQLNENKAKVMLQALDSKFDVVTASSLEMAHLGAGERFNLDAETFPLEKNLDYVVSELVFRASDTSYPESIYRLNDVYSLKSMETEDLMLLDWQAEGPTNYANTFKCIGSDKVASPVLSEQPKRPILGIQMAIITGPEGMDGKLEEIYTDGLCCYRIHFLWDRAPKGLNSSGWVRALSSYHVYRVGTVVAVNFIGNNPNQPIIIGSISDSEHMPAQKLPQEQHISRFQARSYDIKETEYNRVEMNDKLGQQLLSLLASKDMQIEVNENLMVTVKEGECFIKVKGKVTIESEDNLVLEGKEVLIKAEGYITHQAKDVKHKLKK